MRTWVYDPHSGGKKILSQQHTEICKEVDQYARMCSWYPRIKLKVRFKNQFCYIDSEDSDHQVFRLCRLRNLMQGGWSMALFTYSNEQYEPCSLLDGKSEGTLKAALKLCEAFII